jgi:hypothetical protein
MPFVTDSRSWGERPSQVFVLLGLLPIEDCGVTHKSDLLTRQPNEALPTHRADTQTSTNESTL